MKKITIILLLFFFGICIAEVCAEETEEPMSDEYQQEESYEQERYVFPVIKPSISIIGSYRFIHTDGSNSAEEFEYLHNSPVLGGELRTIMFPHRLHIDFDISNEKDYYGDISYAYKDLIVFRGLNSTLFHNLDNVNLFPFGGSNPILRNDVGETYGIKKGISSLFLRFKTPDFPAHLYLEGNFVSKSGTAQQMFYRMGSPSRRTSEERNIDSLTSIYTVGANSHLGPVEMDLSHSEKRFDVDGRNALVDTFVAGGGRAAGDYYHNRISELKSSSNTLKLHTSLTGKLVASATVSKTDKENSDSGATADYLSAAGEITWMPRTDLTFVVKYRHREIDIDNPDSVKVKNLTGTQVYDYSVADSISSASDLVSGTIKYRPLKGVLLKADYSFEEVRRNNEEHWMVIPGSTQRHKFSLSGNVKVMSGLNLKASYIHKDIDKPSTNTEPDKSDEGVITLSCVPLQRLSAFISYGLKTEKRESLEFVYGDPATVHTADNRKVKNDRLLAMVSYMPLNGLSLNASYAYMHNKVRQDSIYGTSNYGDLGHPTPPAEDSLLPYKTTSRNYAFSVNFSPKKFLSMNGGISHTVSQGAFYPSDSYLTSPVSIASFSKLKIKETTYSASGEYKFKHGFATGIQYRHSVLDDVLNNRYDDVKDGRAQIILLTLSKKW